MIDPFSKSNISWDPLESSGSSFKTSVLKKVDAKQISFVPTSGAIVFMLLFTVAGLAMVIAGRFQSNTQAMLISLLGAAFLLVAGVPLIFGENGITFYNIKGKLRLVKSGRFSRSVVDLTQKGLVALQVLEKQVQGDENYFTCYELNLVFEDASRVNVLNFGGKKDKFINEANILSEFLGKPLWVK